MPNIVACPGCGRQLNVPDGLIGQMVRCPGCMATFTAAREMLEPRVETAVPLEHQPSISSYPPSSRLLPHRGGTVLVLGILSIVICACVGLILGPMAWVMGSNDLAEMRSGRMDRRGEAVTNAGRICGIIGTILSALVCCAGGPGVLGWRGAAVPPRPFR